MASLRLAFFTECYRPIINGVVASVDALADGLRERGHDVRCVAPRFPGERERDRSIVRVPSLPLPTRTAYRLTLPVTPRRVERALAGVHLVHAHSPFVTGWMAVRYARRAGVPLVFTYHTQLEQYAHYVPFEEAATRRAAGRLTRAFAQAADAVIVPTDAMRRRLRDELGVTTPVHVIPSGIDVDRFASGVRSDATRRRLGVPDGAQMLLCTSRLGKEKNLTLALEALARIDDDRVHLVLVGDGPHREALVADAARLGILGRLHLAGAMPRDALPDVYASADAFVFPSRSETQGLVLAEALAAGLPIVAVDTPQSRDVLEDAADLTPNESPAFAAAIRAALAAGGRAAGARRSTLVAARRFDSGALVERVLELYRGLIVPG